jgi:outer membrane autotransporter protein
MAALSAATLMVAAHPAQAGSCTVVDGVYVCSGPAVSGEPAININLIAPVTVTTTAGFGLDSFGANRIVSASGLSFTDNFQSTIKGSTTGLLVENDGTGSLSITTTGAVIGTGGSGIDARTDNTSTDMTIATASVTGRDYGIRARHFGTGALSITATGAVEATGGRRIGIYAYAPNGNGLTISATDVSGTYTGIWAFSGSGALSITTTGTVTTTTNSGGAGIYATGYGTGIDVTAKDVTSVGRGIAVRNYGSGATTVTTTGTVTAANGDGIGVRNYSENAGDITISANAVTGARAGIAASGYYGNVTITTTGAVSATGTGDSGYNGIYANTSNNATVDIAGMVTGTGEGAAVNMRFVGGTATLALRAGWGLTGRADGNFNTDSVIALRGDADSTLALGDIDTKIRGFSGLVKEGASNWTLTGSTGEFAFNKVDVQAGTLTLDSATLGLTAFGKKRVVPSERVKFELILDSDTDTTDPDSDDLVMQPEPIPAVLSIAAQGTLAAFGTSQVTGMVSNAGTLSLRNGTAGDRLQITSNLTGQGGTLAFDTVMDNGAGGGTSDRVQVAGNLDGTHNVVINPLGAGALTVEDGILLVEVAGTSTADALSMQGGGLLHGGFLYKLDQGGAAAGTANNWYLQSEKVAVAQTVAAIPVAQLGFGTVNSFSQRSTGRTSVQPSGPSGGGDDSVTVSSKSMPSMPSLAGATLWISGSASQDEGTLNKALAGTRFDNTGNTLSVGVDLPTQGAWVLGVSGQVGKLSSTVFDALTSSKAETDAYSLGFSATWQGGSDRYVDVQAQVATFSTDYTSAAGTLQRDAKSDSLSFGVEAGQTYTLGTATTVTPYVQLSRSVLDGGSFTAAGATYDMGRNGSTVARVGAKVDHRLAGGQRVYASAELLHDFDPSREITINGTSLSYDAPENALSSALGMELDLAGNDRLFAEIAYTSDLSSDVRAKGASLTIGYAKTW